MTDVTHVHILVHHTTIGTIRRVDHVTRQQCALVQISSSTRHANSLLSGRVELDHHGTIHLSAIHVVDTLHVDQVRVLALNS